MCILHFFPEKEKAPAGFRQELRFPDYLRSGTSKCRAYCIINGILRSLNTCYTSEIEDNADNQSDDGKNQASSAKTCLFRLLLLTLNSKNNADDTKNSAYPANRCDKTEYQCKNTTN